MTRCLALWLLCGLGLWRSQMASAAEFTLREAPGEHLDVLWDGRVVARYMLAHDPQRLEETYKPYLHVFDAAGEKPITKGAGGQFAHHRGIFAGWMKIGHQGQSYDRWHMKGGEIIHRQIRAPQAGAESAVFTSLADWNDAAGRPILKEERTQRFSRPAEAGRLLIEFTTRLAAVDADVTLDGDPEHAGVQYRPANELDRSQTVYVFPRPDAQPKQDRDYPWVGETYTLDGQQHSVVIFNHPDNPKQTRWSAYRDYGRFGPFATATIKVGEPLTLKYAFLISDGEMPEAAAIQKLWDRFAGAQQESAVPAVTVRPADK